jgi:hypothetical protein
MSVMNLISKFAVEGLGTGALAMVTTSVWVAVTELGEVAAGVDLSRADGPVGDAGCPEHAASVIVRLAAQRIRVCEWRVM